MTVTTILFLTTPDAARASDVAMSFSPEQIGSGRELYDAYCARCHGAGMVEPGELRKAMSSEKAVRKRS